MSFTDPIAIPHYGFPVRMFTTGVGIVEQGSTGEIQSNVLAIVSSMAGTCPELPSLGITDPTFATSPPSANQILAEIQALEPRATVSEIATALDSSDASWQLALTASVASTGQ